jgi:hypothetical protein
MSTEGTTVRTPKGQSASDLRGYLKSHAAPAQSGSRNSEVVAPQQISIERRNVATTRSRLTGCSAMSGVGI